MHRGNYAYAPANGACQSSDIRVNANQKNINFSDSDNNAHTLTRGLSHGMVFMPAGVLVSRYGHKVACGLFASVFFGGIVPIIL